jgi:hypothetical protein
MTAKKKAAPKAEVERPKTAIASTPAAKPKDPAARVLAHMAEHGLPPEKAFGAYNAGGTCGICKGRIE